MGDKFRTYWVFNLNLSKKYRYIVIGGVNTFIGYLLFLVIYILLNKQHYLVILVISYSISICSAYLLYSRFVFTLSTVSLKGFYRFSLVYAGSFLFNIFMLPLLIEYMGFDIVYSQTSIVIITIVLSYIVHNRYSFRVDN